MKKLNKILTLSLASLLLFACDDIVAEPEQVIDGDNLVEINGNSDYFKNNFEDILENLNDSGNANTTVMKQITSTIAKEVVSQFYNITIEEFNTVLENVKDTLANKTPATLSNEKAITLRDIILEEVKDTMISKVSSGSYSTDNLFDERKLVNELKISFYKIEGTTFNQKYLITPDSTYEEIFKADYSDYIERNIYPDILENLLTSVYLYNNQYSSLGRAAGRGVRYIKLETISTHKDSVPVLINSYFTSFINGDNSFPTDSFDLNSLARIYKGVYNLDTPNAEEQKEISFASTYGITTRQDVVEEELEKVGTFDDATQEYIIHTDSTLLDTDLLSTYTGSSTYPVSYGKTLKDRELATLDIVVDDGIVDKNNGVSDLPEEMRSRLFSSQIENNLIEITSSKYGSIKVLTPKTTPNIDESDPYYYLHNYAYYDSSTSAYYIVLVDSYYNITSLKPGNPEKYIETDPNIEFSQETKDAAMEIARLLSTTSSNKKKAIIYYLEEYGLEFGDQSFYDYIESTYPELVEDE